MGRKSNGPRYYKSKGAWFANIDGNRIPLVSGPKNSTEKIAWELYNLEVEARQGFTDVDYAPVWSVLNAYLNWTLNRQSPPPVAPSTHTGNLRYLQPFMEMFGEMRVAELHSEHFDKFLTARRATWSSGTRRNAMTALRAAFSWAAGPGKLITHNPVKHVAPPRHQVDNSQSRRNRIPITWDEHQKILWETFSRHVSSLSYMLTYLWWTGARVSEVRLLRKKEWDSNKGVYVIEPTKENQGRYKMARTGRDRLLYIPDKLLPLNEALLNQTKDHLFLNRDGKPYSLDSLECAFRGVCRKNARKGVVLYSYRHAFVTRWLENGGDPYHLSELLGTSLTMIQRHYSHLFDSHEVLKTSLNLFS